MSGNYVGQYDASIVLGEGNPRYFYALRRTDEGTLFFAKIDQLKDTNYIVVNDPGLNENDFEEFEYGVDFFNGRLEADHSRPYSNLHWDQYRWDNKNMYYYIDSQGNFVVRVNQEYTYDPSQIVS